MKTKVLIHVTRQHIQDADMPDARGCAIALAIRDAIPLVDKIAVGSDTGFMTHVLGEENGCKFELPGTVIIFIHDMLRHWGDRKWTRKLRFKPFTFELLVDDHFVAQPVQRVSLIPSREKHEREQCLVP